MQETPRSVLRRRQSHLQKPLLSCQTLRQRRHRTEATVGIAMAGGLLRSSDGSEGEWLLKCVWASGIATTVRTAAAQRAHLWGWLFGFALAAVGSSVGPYVALGCDCDAVAPGSFRLRTVDATTVEIALAWQAVNDASTYVLERDTTPAFAAPTSYTLSSTTHAYGDTGRSPDSKVRFHAPSALAAALPYYYRVRAKFAAQPDQLSDCACGQLALGPPADRSSAGPHGDGSGDLWADIVLGKPDFGQNAFLKTNDTATQFAGGVLLDKSRSPQPLYVADSNHNRILGFDHVGTCQGLMSNVAQGAAYTKTPSNPGYADAGGVFTDGADSGTWQSSPATTFGYQNRSFVDIVIDLGVATTFDAVVLNSGALTSTYTAKRLEFASRSWLNRQTRSRRLTSASVTTRQSFDW